ncbi:MAG: YgjV family protein [Clostridia bacterium]|nr:YgjV family protein [Clostridia bacterium]
MNPDLIARIVGYVAMATVCLSFQVKNPRGTLWVMAAATGLFSIHFALLGAVTGCILNALNVLRNLAILCTDAHKLSGKIAMHVLSPAYWAAPFVFLLLPGVTVGIPDFVLGVIMTIASYVFWHQNATSIRVVHFFAVSPGWMVYNVLAGSIPGVITETLNMLSVVVYWVRGWIKKSKKSTESEKLFCKTS